MLLKTIYNNAQYITDEDMTSSQIIAIANGAVSEINTAVGTNLPLFTVDNYEQDEYVAVTNSWQLRLIEPYLSFGIASNDTDANSRDFHYNRFKQALLDFKNKGLSDIKKENEDGSLTGYEGRSTRVVKINASARPNPFKGWW